MQPEEDGRQLQRSVMVENNRIGEKVQFAEEDCGVGVIGDKDEGKAEYFP